MSKWTVHIEYLELDQKLYCLEYDDRRIANITKEQFEDFERLLAKLSTEQPPAGEFTKRLRAGIRLRDNRDKCGDPVEVIIDIKLINETCAIIDRSEAGRKDLLTALERDDLLANQAILATPTGDLRNKLTEINILRIAAIAKEKEVKI